MSFFRSLWGGDDKDAEKDKAAESKEKGDAESGAKDIDPNDEVEPPAQAPQEGSMGSLLWSILSSKMGSDVVSSGVSLPAWMYEPLTILQRTAENLEHHALLDLASQQKDRATRMAYVAAFAISAYGNTTDARTKTNFNPILGETFEFVDKDKGLRFFGEQVSHHPPISAFHVIGPGSRWHMWQNSSPSSKFLGNSLDIDTRGRSHVYFPAHKDHFGFRNPNTRVHNIILGSFWYEHFGELHITHAPSKMACTVTFKKAGLFQGAQHDVEGHVKDEKGNKLIKITGAWNSHVTIEWLKDCEDGKKGEKREVLKLNPIFVPPYNFPLFSSELNKWDTPMKHYLLPSDSRRRPDRRNLERGDADSATKWKMRLEEQQRQERKARAPDTHWTPLWFARVEDCTEDQKARWPVPADAFDEGDLWVYVGDYWEQRDIALKALEADKKRASTTALSAKDYYPSGEQLHLRPLQLKDTAADFLKCEMEELEKKEKEKGTKEAKEDKSKEERSDLLKQSESASSLSEDKSERSGKKKKKKQKGEKVAASSLSRSQSHEQMSLSEDTSEKSRGKK